MDTSPIEWITVQAGPLAIQVSSDYVKRADGVRAALTPKQAQVLADANAAMLPTTKIVRMIEAHAAMIPFQGLYSEKQEDESMSSERLIVLSNTKIEVDIALRPREQGPVLYAGHKKDIVIGKTRKTHPNKVTIYGGVYKSGKRVQGLMPASDMGPKIGHSLSYFDYSHGVRLVKLLGLLGGSPVTLSSILGDRKHCVMLSGQGVLTKEMLRY